MALNGIEPRKTLLLDDRIGSKHLAGPLSKHLPKVKLKRLDYGDAYFQGWRRKEVVRIGVELKTLGDLVGSLKSKRLVDRQLPGMAEAYDIRYLLIEGIWRPDKWGRIESLHYGKWRPFNSLTYSQVNRFLCTLEQLGGVTVRRTASVEETAHCIADLWWWWQKPWHKHKGHTGFHKLRIYDSNALAPHAVRRRLRRVAEEFPHLGWFRGIDVADHFKSIREMVNAPKKAWLRIPRFGEKMASDIVEALEAEQ